MSVAFSNEFIKNFEPCITQRRFQALDLIRDHFRVFLLKVADPSRQVRGNVSRIERFQPRLLHQGSDGALVGGAFPFLHEIFGLCGKDTHFRVGEADGFLKFEYARHRGIGRDVAGGAFREMNGCIHAVFEESFVVGEAILSFAASGMWRRSGQNRNQQRSSRARALVGWHVWGQAAWLDYITLSIPIENALAAIKMAKIHQKKIPLPEQLQKLQQASLPFRFSPA